MDFLPICDNNNGSQVRPNNVICEQNGGPKEQSLHHQWVVV